MTTLEELQDSLSIKDAVIVYLVDEDMLKNRWMTAMPPLMLQNSIHRVCL